jgi:hypothetical protein
MSAGASSGIAIIVAGMTVMAAREVNDIFTGAIVLSLFVYFTRRVAARMSAAREELLAGTSELQPSDGYAQRSGFSPWPPMLILALMEVIAPLPLLVR